MKKLVVIFAFLLLVSLSFAQGPCPDTNPAPQDGSAAMDPEAPEITPDFTTPVGVICDCLVADTVITLADGQTAFIQDILQRQEIVSYTEDNLFASVAEVGASFNQSLVNFVSNRIASQSMYELVDTFGNVLQGTGNHPIITVNRGIVPMAQLQVGDTLVTLYGESQVASLSTFDYQGSVHNLALSDFNNESTDLEANLSTHTFFANNILVGDLNLQYALGR